MKKLESFISVCVIGLAVLMLSSCGSIKSSAEKDRIARQVQEQLTDAHFVFVAETAYPLNMRTVYLTGEFDVTVKKDTVNAYLPYFGRAYVAPMNPYEGGIKFTSSTFEYNIEPGKQKGEWHVKIITLDTPKKYTLDFDIWENGRADLYVLDPDRQAITFHGYLKID
jgi:hypothetical protein